jgi:hypothetical protein
MGASFEVVQVIQEILAVRIGFVEALSNRRLFHVGTNFKRDIFSLDRGAARLGDCPTMLAVLRFNAIGDAIRDIVEARLSQARGGQTTEEHCTTPFQSWLIYSRLKIFKRRFLPPKAKCAPSTA